MARFKYTATQLAISGLMTIIPLVGISAETEPEPIFVESDGPPPGFEADALAVTQVSVVDVFFQNEYLTSTQASFNKRSLTFAHPEEIIQIIQGLNNREQILEALKQGQDTHPELLCPGEEVPYCEPLKPVIVGIVFNPNLYRVDIFFDPQFLPVQEHRKLPELLPSSAGFSALSQENFFLAGTGTANAYSLSNTGVIGYGQSVFTVRSYLQQIHLQTQQYENRFELQQATWGYLRKEHFLQMGILSTVGGSDFITSQSILGVALTNKGLSEAIGSSTSLEYAATEVPVYLSLPSTVRVKRGSELLYTTLLPAGKHLLDTRSFPSGSYDLILEIIDTSGSQTSDHLFFVKADQLPSKGMTKYYMAAGLSQALPDSEQPFFVHPHYTRTPIGLINGLVSVWYNYGVETNLLFSPKSWFWSNEFLYFGNRIKVSPSFLLANHAAGYGMGAHFSARQLSTDWKAIKMLRRPGSNYYDDAFPANQALISNDIQVMGSLNYSWWDNDFNVSSRLAKDRTEAHVERSYNFRISRPLYQSNRDTLGLSFTATKTPIDRTVLLTLNWTMVSDSYRGISSSGYSRTNQSVDGKGQNHLHLSTEWTKQIEWNRPDNLQVAGRYYYGDRSHYYGGKAEYRSNKMRLLTNVQQNLFNTTSSSTTYSAELNTHFATADGEWSFGYDPVWQSGVLITLSAREEVPVDVFVDGSWSAKITAGRPSVLYLAPFKTYHITIMPAGEGLYQFDHKPRIVTLYQGNFTHLNWDLRTKFLLFTRIVNEKGQPVVNALLEGQNEFEATDEQGYLQADLIDGDQHLSFKRTDHPTCQVRLPESIQPDANGLVQIEKLVCVESKGQ